MAQHEKLRHALLTEQPRCNSTGYVTYRAFELSLRFGIPEPHVREIMGEMANDGLIWLAAYAPCPFQPALGSSMRASKKREKKPMG